MSERDFRREWDKELSEAFPDYEGGGIEINSLWIINILDEVDRLRKELDHAHYIIAEARAEKEEIVLEGDATNG